MSCFSSFISYLLGKVTHYYQIIKIDVFFDFNPDLKENVLRGCSKKENNNVGEICLIH